MWIWIDSTCKNPPTGLAGEMRETMRYQIIEYCGDKISLREIIENASDPMQAIARSATITAIEKRWAGKPGVARFDSGEWGYELCDPADPTHTIALWAIGGGNMSFSLEAMQAALDEKGE